MRNEIYFQTPYKIMYTKYNMGVRCVLQRYSIKSARIARLQVFACNIHTKSCKWLDCNRSDLQINPHIFFQCPPVFKYCHPMANQQREKEGLSHSSVEPMVTHHPLCNGPKRFFCVDTLFRFFIKHSSPTGRTVTKWYSNTNWLFADH